MTVAQELQKEPCKSNPRGIKCTKKLRRVLQKEMKSVPAIQRKAAINKRLKEIKRSSATVVKGSARRQLKKTFAGNTPAPQQQPGGANFPQQADLTAPLSQQVGQQREDFQKANLDRLNASALAGDRSQSRYYAQQLGLIPSIRNNALNQSALAQFGQPATNNFQAQPIEQGVGGGYQALAGRTTIAQANARAQARLRGTPSRPPPQAQRPGEEDESKSQDRPTLVDPGRIYGLGNIGTPPAGSIGAGSRTSAPVVAQNLRGISTVQPGQRLSLTRQQAEQRNLAFSGTPGDANDPDLLPARRTRKLTEKGKAFAKNLRKKLTKSPGGKVTPT